MSETAGFVRAHPECLPVMRIVLGYQEGEGRDDDITRLRHLWRNFCRKQ